MREVTTHHDSHGLNESIKIEAGEPGPGGASHEYDIHIIDSAHGVKGGISAMNGGVSHLATLRFQKGPRAIEGSTPGITESALLAIVRDRLESFQAGEYACEENELTLSLIKTAMFFMRSRADERARRGVLGTYAK